MVALGVVIADNVSEDSSTPPDTVFPIITILGDNPATVELGSTYSDAGATTNEGTISVVSNNVNPNIVGSYSIVYSATDAAGNTSTSTRTVNVVDTIAPVLTVTGDNPATVELGTTYTDAGATATDASGNTSTATRTVIVEEDDDKDFWQMTAVSSLEEWGANAQKFVDNNGGIAQASIYGDVVSCEDQEIYQASNKRRASSN